MTSGQFLVLVGAICLAQAMSKTAAFGMGLMFTALGMAIGFGALKW